MTNRRAGQAMQLAGIAVVTAGTFVLAPWLGLVVLGICLLVFGALTEMG